MKALLLLLLTIPESIYALGGAIAGSAGQASVSNATGVLPVANGGTSTTTFTSNAVLTGNGTNAIQAQGTVTIPSSQNLVVSQGIAASTAAFGSGATISTFTTSGALTLASGAAINLSGSAGNIINQASVTAGGFFGNGAGLTSIGDASVSLSTGAITAGQFGDNRVSVSTNAIASGKFGDNRVNISTAGVGAGTFGDTQVSISTAGVTAGKFGDTRVGISTAGVTSGTFGDSQVAISTGGLSGTLPVNKGGTGSATLTANQVMLGNGTGAIQQVSTFTLTGAGLGVGTSNPAYALDITGAQQTSGQAIIKGSATVQGNFGVQGNVNQQMTFNGSSLTIAGAGITVAQGASFATASGNVGIGTTNPGSLFNVAGNAQLGTSLGNSACWVDGANAFVMGNSCLLNLGSGLNGQFTLVSTTSVGGQALVSIVNNAGSLEIFRIQQNGNVGIGTTNPAFQLDVSSVARFGNAVYANFVTTTTGPGGGAAGALMTATCPAQFFAIGGACNCTGGVSITSTIDDFSPALTSGSTGTMPTGYRCQDSGGTGASCIASAICSKMQN